MRVLVTGAAGFVASHLVPRLEAEGATVIGIDREVPISDAKAVAEAAEATRPDAIVHLAAQSSVAASTADPRETYAVNYLGTRSVLEAAWRLATRPRVLIVSSGQVYGSAAPGAPPFDERAPLRPDSPYDRSKAAADLLAGVWAERGLEVVRARPFNHTGPGQRDSFVAASFARQIAEIEAGAREPVIRVGNLEAVRDFLDVSDVVEAYGRLLDPAVPTGVYNVASGRGLSARELLDRLLRRSSARPRVEVDPARHRPATASLGDPSRLRAATGWEPRIRLEETLSRLLDHWRAKTRGA